MYRMSKRSLVIRLSMIIPFTILWCIGGFIWLGCITFDFLWDKTDRLRDKFQSWVDKIAPLGG